MRWGRLFAGGGSLALGCSRRSAAAVLAPAHLAQAGLLALQLAQVVEARAAHAAAGHHLELVDVRRCRRENALDADASGDFAHRERAAQAAARAPNHYALKHLNALFLAF